jgi:hypothetical protein
VKHLAGDEPPADFKMKTGREVIAEREAARGRRHE